MDQKLEYLIELVTKGDGKKAVEELKKLDTAQKRQGDSAAKAAKQSKIHGDASRKSAEGFDRATRGLKNLVAGYLSFRTAITVTTQAFQKSQRLIGIENLFDINLGKRAIGTLDDLRQEADRIGVSFLDLSRGFAKFNAAAKSSNLTLTEQREVFIAVTEAARSLNLDSQQTSRIFLALEQMVSRGTVSMEELRQQLGDSLPGAFQLAAKAAGKTTAEFSKLVEQGKVATDDFLPKFTLAIRQAFPLGNSANTAAADLERLRNSWDELLISLGTDLPFKTAIDSLNSLVKGVGSTLKAIDLQTIGDEINKLPNADAARAEFFANRFPLAPRLDDPKLLQTHPELFNFDPRANATQLPFGIRLHNPRTQEGEFVLKDIHELNRLLEQLNIKATKAADGVKKLKQAQAAPPSAAQLRQEAQLLINQTQMGNALRAAAPSLSQHGRLSSLEVLNQNAADNEALVATLGARQLLNPAQLQQVQQQLTAQTQTQLAAMAEVGAQVIRESQAASLGAIALQRHHIEESFRAQIDAVRAYYQVKREAAQNDEAQTLALIEAEKAAIENLQSLKRDQINETKELYVGLRQVSLGALNDLSHFGAQAFTNLFQNGKLEVRQFFSELLAGVAQAIVQMTILAAIKRSLSGSSFGAFLGFADGGVSFANQGQGVRRAASGIQTVTGPTILPQFNVLAGEAGTEMLTVLSKPREMHLGGMSIVSGMAQGNPLSIINSRDLASLIPAANGMGPSLNSNGQSGSGPGKILVEVRHSEEAEVRIKNEAADQAVVRVHSDLTEDTELRQTVTQVAAG